MSIGIYKITNKINGKVYIGQSWNIEKRWKSHKLNKNILRNEHLYNSFKKYGIENFSFEILDETDLFSDDWNWSQEILDKEEQYYINYYDSINYKKGYNKRGGGSKGIPTEETIIKLKLAQKRRLNNPEYLKKLRERAIENFKDIWQKPDIRKKLINSAKNRWSNLENREKAKQSALYWNKNNPEAYILRRKHINDSLNTIEYKEKRSKITKGLWNKEEFRNKICKQVFCVEINTIYESLTKASIITGISEGHICSCCKGNRKTAGGFHWEYYYDGN